MGKKQKSKKTVKATADSRIAASANVAKSAKIAEPEAATVEKNTKASVGDSMGLKTHLFDNCENLKSLTDKLKSMSVSSNSTIVPSESDDSDDENTDTEEKLLSNLRSTEIMSNPKCSRGEKKSRRLLMKHDLKRIPNVSRVTMRKDKNVMLYIDHPDVYQWPNSMTYICFGEVHVDNPSNAAAAQAAERYINDGRPSQHLANATAFNHSHTTAAASDDEDIDENALGDTLDEKDIELVIMQANCSRQAAIKALLKHDSDVVNAIMELTIGVNV